jgi:Cu(I)/Ag(I) efflux system membrane fusion protein
MKPDVKFDKPGKSPFMDMDLVPKYADENDNKSSAGIRIDPTQVQNLGLKTQKVTRGTLNYAQTIPANVSYNDYQFVIVQARAEGFVEKVYPLTTGDKVKKGTPLVDITIPDWVEAQSEFLLLSGTGGTPTQIKGFWNGFGWRVCRMRIFRGCVRPALSRPGLPSGRRSTERSRPLTCVPA